MPCCMRSSCWKKRGRSWGEPGTKRPCPLVYQPIEITHKAMNDLKVSYLQNNPV
jgi:hypothetical protein